MALNCISKAHCGRGSGPCDLVYDESDQMLHCRSCGCVAPAKRHFVLRLEGPAGQSGIHGLRAILKELLRRHGFRCLDACEDDNA